MTLFGFVFWRWTSRVKLRPIKHLTTDLRSPRQMHKLRRKKECRKILP
jgi:hypothetical protein